MLTPKIKKYLLAICVSTLLSAITAACQSTSTLQPTESTPGMVEASLTPKPARTPKLSTPTPGVTHVPTDTPDEIDQHCCTDYNIAILQAPYSLNYWAYLGEDNSLWTGYVIGDEAPSLYKFPDLRSTERLDFVPALAANLPPESEQQDDFWVIPVKLLDTAAWSDGEPITADDIVFTIQTVFDLQLGGRWSEFYPAKSLADVKARDDHTVEFFFHSQPGLGEWQFAVAMGPILPQHYWETYVDEALELVKGIDPPETCSGTLTEAQQTACRAYTEARKVLYDVEPVSPPSGGGYATEGFTSDRTIRRKINPHYYAAGMKVNEYPDGTWVRVFADGTMQQYYGEAEGDPVISYRHGPFNRSIEFYIYESRIVAYDALSRGLVDYVLNPYSLTDEWLLQTAQSEAIVEYTSLQNGLAYLAFNLRRQPFDRPEFRQALEILIDRQQIVEQDLQGLAYPAFSIIPEPNAFWWNPSLAPEVETPSLEERLELALQSLKDAGWSWKTEPSWDAASGQITPGEELRLPDRNPMPETNLIFPAPESDLLMAAFGEEIADLLTVLGVTVVAEALERDLMINRILIVGGSFDLYILDWQLPLYPGYLCELFYSENDTLLTGGYNTTGYSNLQFDQLCDSFLVETDVQLAKRQAYRMQAMLAKDRPYIPLFNPQVVDMLRENVTLPYFPIFDGIPGKAGFQNDARVLIR